MEITTDIKQIINEVHSLKLKSKDIKLPNNTYFLSDNKILCKENNNGDSRYPYMYDGMCLWCHSSGYVSMNESTFYVLTEAMEGDANTLNFFLGIKKKDGYMPISFFQNSKNLYEKNIKRYTVFAPWCAYYFVEYKKIIGCLRLTLDKNKSLFISCQIINNGSEEVGIYSSLFLNCMMEHSDKSSVETKWFKEAEILDDNTIKLFTVEDIDRQTHLKNFGLLKKEINSSTQYEIENTTSRMVYAENKCNSILLSNALLNGKFNEYKKITRFSDTAIAGDFIRTKLDKNSVYEVNYSLDFYFDEEEFNKALKNKNSRDLHAIFDNLKQEKLGYINSEKMLKFDFKGNDYIDGKLFNNFIKQVINQVDYCATSKNSSLSMLGVRDLYQAIECALLFKSEDMRKRIVDSLNFIGENGRCPRQYSFPSEGQLPKLDLREFIDQGHWIIQTIYKYLAITQDYSILDEKCGYYIYSGKKKVEFSNKIDSVLEHLIKIVNYNVENIDPNSKCLKTLYGDWNDAIDGLGTKEGSEGFGTGVSIMATFHFYSCLNWFIEILNHENTRKDLVILYSKALETLKEGILKNAIQEKNGEYKIVHGWGDNMSYFVGSFDDVDHQSRDTLTSCASFINSDFYLLKKDLLPHVLKTYERLDSKYGYKTFMPYFAKDCKGVGRIVNLPKGTAENASTYIHGSIFAVESLFKINEDSLAWQQLYKLLPITHEFISTSPFIMPNSYINNPEIDCDGESMNDWYTGSSNTLIKSLVFDVFGLDFKLDELIIKPIKYFPFKEATVSLQIPSCHITLTHYCKNKGERVIKINNKKVKVTYDENTEKYIYKLKRSKLVGNIDIKVID